MLGGKKTPRSRPQERARAADAKPNASKPLTQAPGGKPRARRKGAKATRQPVTRTHGRARPAAKPTRPTTERRPAGAGATAPHHAHQRRRDHASGRRNGGEAGGDGAGRAALGRESQPPPFAISAGQLIEPHQQRVRRRRKRRARGAGRGHDRRVQLPEGRGTNSPAPRPERRKAERTGNRASHRAQSGRARRRSGRIWPPVRLCGGFFRWWWVVLPFQRKKREKWRKNANFRVDMCRTWLYTGYGRVEHARKECRTWKTRNENGQFRPSTHGVLARGCRMTYSSG